MLDLKEMLDTQEPQDLMEPLVYKDHREKKDLMVILDHLELWD